MPKDLPGKHTLEKHRCQIDAGHGASLIAWYLQAGGYPMTQSASYTLAPIGFVRSTLTRPEDAPMQGSEGAPDAWLEIEPALVDALKGIEAGDAVMLLTWLHEANRDTLQVHPRDDQTRPLMGVFATRSQDRPNPIGLHRVHVLEIEGARLKVGPLEAIDSTPVLDIKPVLTSDES
jgi:tRNA-Thr(GGU) m(6)t(6)A37 methyltransferase TsaA